MVAGGLLDERVEVINGVTQYTYSLSPGIRDLVANEPDRDMDAFRDLGSELIDPSRTHLWWLELGSTILFMFRQTGDWGHALSRACEFKKVKAEDPASQKAFELAKRLHKSARNN
jgi:hypothetical protein